MALNVTPQIQFAPWRWAGRLATHTAANQTDVHVCGRFSVFPAEAENGRPLAVRHVLDLVACDRPKVHREPVAFCCVDNNRQSNKSQPNSRTEWRTLKTVFFQPVVPMLNAIWNQSKPIFFFYHLRLFAVLKTTVKQ